MIMLDQNNFNGTIPSEFGRLTKLSKFSFDIIESRHGLTVFSSNRLYFTPADIELRVNQLSGTIPTQLGELTNLGTTFL
jgi:hypothetical protein